MRFRTSRLTGRIFFWWLILAVALLAVAEAQATTSKTAIVDVLYQADGTPAHGTLLISWPAFTTAGGDAIAAGSMTVSLGASGSVQAAVFPNTGSTPQGTYYKVLVDLDDGTRSTEYWVVPQVPQTTIAAVRASLVPQSQAMQFVGRDYVDSAIASAVENVLDLTGSQTITGVKTFQNSPQMPTPMNPGDAASRQFVLDTVGNSALAQTTPGTVNATQYQVNGTALASSNLSDAASLAKISQIPTQTSQLTDNSGFITSAGAPVQSVNGMSGAVMLTIPAAQVSSDWSAASGVTQILNKPAIGTAATHAATDFDAAGAAASVAAMVSAASATTPAMDSAASTGTASTFARGDHVHPTDTSRQAAMPGVASDSNNGMTVAGNLAACTTLPCPSSGTQISPTAGITTPAVSAVAYKNRSDIVDMLADCGAQGAGSTSCNYLNMSGCHDDWATIQACIVQKCNSGTGTFVTVGGVSYGSLCPNAVTFLFPRTCNGANCISYYFSQTLMLPGNARIEGVGTGESANGTNLGFASGQTGIAARAYNLIAHFGVFGGDPWVIGQTLATNTADAVELGSGSTLVDAELYGFGRLGVMTASDLSSALPSGQQYDATTVQDVVVKMMRGDAFHASGGDGGVGTRIKVQAFDNQGTAFFDTSLYGNTYINPTSTANGTAYNASAGTFIRPYSESDTSLGAFCVSGLCATVIAPRGNLLAGGGAANVLGLFDSNYAGYKYFPEGMIVFGQPYGGETSYVSTWIGWDPDYYGVSPLVMCNVGGDLPPFSVNNSCSIMRRTAYGNVSGWWGQQGAAGAFSAAKAGILWGDALTTSGRSALTGALAWHPNGFGLGVSGSNPLMYVQSGTAAPTSGNWLVGDLVINSAPSVGGVWGWRCTTAGTPGTWEAMLQVPSTWAWANITGAPTIPPPLPTNALGWLHNDGSGNLSWSTPTGGGNVTGPASSTANDVACFNGTSGTALQECTTPISGAAVATAVANTGFVMSWRPPYLPTAAANSTYYIGNLAGQAPTTTNIGRVAAAQIPRTCTATKIIYYVANGGAIDSGSNTATFNLSVGGSGTASSTPYSDTTANIPFNTVNGQSVQVTINDVIASGTNLMIQLKTPTTWGTTPTNVYLGADLYCQ